MGGGRVPSLKTGGEEWSESLRTIEKERLMLWGAKRNSDKAVGWGGGKERVNNFRRLGAHTPPHQFENKSRPRKKT